LKIVLKTDPYELIEVDSNGKISPHYNIHIQVFPDKIRVCRDKESDMPHYDEHHREKNVIMKRMIKDNTDPHTGRINWQKIANVAVFVPPELPLQPVEIEYIMSDWDKREERRNNIKCDVTMVVTPTHHRFVGLPEFFKLVGNRKRDMFGKIRKHTNQWTGRIDWIAVGNEILQHVSRYYHCRCVALKYEADPEEAGAGDKRKADAVSGSGSLINPYVL